MSPGEYMPADRQSAPNGSMVLSVAFQVFPMLRKGSRIVGEDRARASIVKWLFAFIKSGSDRFIRTLSDGRWAQRICLMNISIVSATTAAMREWVAGRCVEFCFSKNQLTWSWIPIADMLPMRAVAGRTAVSPVRCEFIVTYGCHGNCLSES